MSAFGAYTGSSYYPQGSQPANYVEQFSRFSNGSQVSPPQRFNDRHRSCSTTNFTTDSPSSSQFINFGIPAQQSPHAYSYAHATYPGATFHQQLSPDSPQESSSAYSELSFSSRVSERSMRQDSQSDASVRFQPRRLTGERIMNLMPTGIPRLDKLQPQAYSKICLFYQLRDRQDCKVTEQKGYDPDLHQERRQQRFYFTACLERAILISGLRLVAGDVNYHSAESELFRLCRGISRHDSDTNKAVRDEFSNALSNYRKNHGLERLSSRGRKKKVPNPPVEEERQPDEAEAAKFPTGTIVDIFPTDSKQNVLGKGYVKSEEPVLIDGCLHYVVVLISKCTTNSVRPFWVFPQASATASAAQLQRDSSTDHIYSFKSEPWNKLLKYQVLAITPAIIAVSKAEKRRLQNALPSETDEEQRQPPEPPNAEEQPIPVFAVPKVPRKRRAAASDESLEAKPFESAIKYAYNSEEFVKAYPDGLTPDTHVLLCIPNEFYIAIVVSGPHSEGDVNDFYSLQWLVNDDETVVPGTVTFKLAPGKKAFDETASAHVVAVLIKPTSHPVSKTRFKYLYREDQVKELHDAWMNWCAVSKCTCAPHN